MKPTIKLQLITKGKNKNKKVRIPHSVYADRLKWYCELFASGDVYATTELALLTLIYKITFRGTKADYAYIINSYGKTFCGAMKNLAYYATTKELHAFALAFFIKAYENGHESALSTMFKCLPEFKQFIENPTKQKQIELVKKLIGGRNNDALAYVNEFYRVYMLNGKGYTYSQAIKKAIEEFEKEKIAEETLINTEIQQTKRKRKKSKVERQLEALIDSIDIPDEEILW